MSIEFMTTCSAQNENGKDKTLFSIDLKSQIQCPDKQSFKFKIESLLVHTPGKRRIQRLT